jgi:hypothetical protein
MSFSSIIETLFWGAHLPNYISPQDKTKPVNVHADPHSAVVPVLTQSHFKEKFYAFINLNALRHQHCDLEVIHHFVDLLIKHPVMVPDEGKIGIVYDHESEFRKLKSLHDAHADKRLWGRIVAKTKDKTGIVCSLLEFSVLQKSHNESCYRHAIETLRRQNL